MKKTENETSGQAAGVAGQREYGGKEAVKLGQEKGVAVQQPMEADGVMVIKEQEPAIYIGPGFHGAVAGTVFKGGLTPALEDLVRDNPEAAELIVPVGRLAEARRDLADPESALAGIYREVRQKLRKEGGETC